MRYWRLSRKIVQYASLLLFLFSFDLFFRLDPLTAIVSMIAGRVFLEEFVFAVLIIILTFIASRFWCGWVCPMGTFLDLFASKSRKKKDGSQVVKISDGWRKAKYMLLSFIIIASIFSSLTLIVFDPITILFRTVAVVIRPLFDFLVSRAESLLYPVPFFQPPLVWVEQTFRGSLLPVLSVPFRLEIFMVIFFLSIVLLNWVAPRFWCRALCPLGALLALPSRLSWIHPRTKETCNACGICEYVCPTDAIRKEGEITIDVSECIMCMDCHERCPKKEIAMTGRVDVLHSRYDPTRRQVLLSMGAAAIGAPLLALADSSSRHHLRLILPPGAREGDFLSLCIRCGMCMEQCPTQGLTPTLMENGLEGIWTPHLVPRVGYCDYACNKCGQVCPTGAIPALDLEEKRKRVMGRAFIDRRRCLPWAKKTQCIVCQEMCPVTPEAIVLNDIEITDGNGGKVSLRRPVVLAERCIGCGACEYNCPLEGKAAIEVFKVD